MSNETRMVFVGYDTREDIAYKVCEYSIYKNSATAEVVPLKQSNLRSRNLYWRDPDSLSSTEFTFTRFLVPALMHYQGWALFCDCDFVWDGDIEELFSQVDDRYAVMVVKHNHIPTNSTKMDGQQQTQYPRKNWSSMILWNCGHPSNECVNVDMVNEQSGQYLHRFSWLQDHEIGEVEARYNFLVGWNSESENGKPFAYHWTEGGPWFENYRNCEYKNVWWSYLLEYANDLSLEFGGKPRNNITWVTSLSKEYYNYIGHITLPTWKDLPGEKVFIWDDKPADLGFGTNVNFFKEVASNLDPWLTEGMGGTKADRFWKKSRAQIWAARKYPGLVIWLDTDISVNKSFSKAKAIELLHPGEHTWGSLDCGDPLDLESGIVAFNTKHPEFSRFIAAYSKGWYNGEIYNVRQPYDNHMLASLKKEFPGRSYCGDHNTWPLISEDERKNEFAIQYSPLKPYFTHHIGIINKDKINKELRKKSK